MRNVVAAIDFSSVSAMLIDRVAAIAQGQGLHIWLVHVAAPDPDFAGYEAGPQEVREQIAVELREEHRQLQAMAEDLRQRGLEATALLVQGPTIKTILDEAEKLGADLIALGSHGRGIAYRALLGSVSEGVLHRTRVPVLIVPARGREEHQKSSRQ